jgi:hypothetical protein
LRSKARLRRIGIRKLIAAMAVSALVAGALVALPAATAGAGGPYESQASETYVAIQSPAEVETVDSNTGAVVGSPASLAQAPVGLSEWYSSGDAPSFLVVAETTGGTGSCSSSCDVQTVSLPSGTVTTQATLTHVPTAVVVSQFKFALVLVPSNDSVNVMNFSTGTWTNAGVSLGLTSGDPMTIAMNPDGEYAYVTDQTAHKVIYGPAIAMSYLRST